MASVPVGQERHLLSVIKRLSFCCTLGEVIEVVRQAARDLTGADGVTFILREGDSVYCAEENAIAPLWKGRRFPAANCVSGWTMLNREPAVIEDVYKDPRVPIEAYKPTFVKSMAMMPVRAEDPTAAIGAYWATHHQATKEELDNLQMLADATALALRNIELLSDLQAALDCQAEVCQREPLIERSSVPRDRRLGPHLSDRLQPGSQRPQVHTGRRKNRYFTDERRDPGKVVGFR